MRESLERVLDTATLRGELEAVLTIAQSGGSIPEDLRLFQSAVGRELLAELKAPRTRKRIEFLRNDDFTCPSEHIRLAEVCKVELLKNRVARCSNCDFLVVRKVP